MMPARPGEPRGPARTHRGGARPPIPSRSTRRSPPRALRFPSEHRAAMAAELATSTIPAVRDAALGFLLDADPAPGAAVLEALVAQARRSRRAEPGGRASRLPSSWLPPARQAKLDPAIRTLRANAAAPEPAPRGEVVRGSPRSAMGRGAEPVRAGEDGPPLRAGLRAHQDGCGHRRTLGCGRIWRSASPMASSRRSSPGPRPWRCRPASSRCGWPMRWR